MTLLSVGMSFISGWVIGAIISMFTSHKAKETVHLRPPRKWPPPPEKESEKLNLRNIDLRFAEVHAKLDKLQPVPVKATRTRKTK